MIKKMNIRSFTMENRFLLNKLIIFQLGLSEDYNSLMILIVVLTISLLGLTQSFLSQSPTWSTHPDFRAGSYRVINTITGPGVPPTYYFSFSTALVTNPPFLAYGFKGYRGTDYLLQEFVTMQCMSVDQGSFLVQVTVTNVTYPILVDVIYIAIDPNYPYYLNVFYDISIDYGNSLANISTNSPNLQYFTNYFDYTGDLAYYNANNTFSPPFSKYRIALFMTAFGFTSNPLEPIYLDVQATIINSGVYMLNATFGYNAACTVLSHSHIIFDTSDYSVYGNMYLYFFEWDITNALAANSYYQLNTILQEDFIMGLKSFTTVSGQCTLDYQWNYITYVSGGSNVTGLQVLPTNPYVGTCGLDSVTSTVFYMMSWTCANPYLFFNITVMMCQTSCGPYTYTNYTDYTCRLCLNTLCYTCNSNDSTICLTCATNWVISGTTCICDTSSGTNQFINGTCYACGDLQFQCLVCSYSANTSLAYDPSQYLCLTCNVGAGYFITPINTCATCNVSFCTTCVGYSTCHICNPGYGVTKTGSCSTCPLDGCQTCVNLTVCSICLVGYLKIGYLCYSCPFTCTCGGYVMPKLANGDCSTLCGDGIIINPPEQCDDGNTVNGDGCSQTCLIQDLSVCSGQPSTCYFNTNLQVALIRSEVSPTTCNTITFTFQIQPALSVLNRLNISWNGFLSSTNTSLALQGSPYYSNDVLQLTYKYNSTIQSKQLTFSININNITTASVYLSQIHNTTIQVQVQPVNNLAAVYCTSSVCTGKANSQAFGYGVSAIGYLGMLLSIFSCKIVGLQMFGVMQLSYFILSDYDYVNPILSGVLNRKQVNGLNIQRSSSSNYDISGRILVNGFTSELFLSNYNVMFLLTVILTVFGLSLYTITYFINRDSFANQQLSQVLHSQKAVSNQQPPQVPRSQYWHNFSKFILKQVLLTFIIFNILNLGFSTGVQIHYISEVEPLSIICMLIALSLMVVVGVAQLVTDKLEFGEYTMKFKQARYQSKYILTTMIYRFTLGLLMALLNEWAPCCIIFVFISAAFLTYICYFDPFNEPIQNIRSKIVHSVHVLILFVAFYYRLESNYSTEESGSLLVPAYLQLIAVGFVIVGSTLMLIYQLYVKIRNWLQSKQQSHKLQDNSMRQDEVKQPTIQFQTVQFMSE